MTKTHRIAANKRFGLADDEPPADAAIGPVGRHAESPRSVAPPGVDPADLGPGHDRQRHGRPGKVVKKAPPA